MRSKNQFLASFLLLLCLVLLGGCRITASKDNQGNDKDVDIRTPLGSISVHKGETDPKATGLSAYPGAQINKDIQGDEGANVNVSSSLFGVKVAVVKFRSEDSPDKVLNFYRKDMTKYGKVVDCSGGFNLTYRHTNDDSPVSCENLDVGRKYKEVLRVGTQKDQRNVAVRASGNGSEFDLIYVRAWDDKSTM